VVEPSIAELLEFARGMKLGRKINIIKKNSHFVGTRKGFLVIKPRKAMKRKAAAKSPIEIDLMIHVS
jgi:hypothetical protein